MALSKAAAWKIVGGLSRTSKMPCHSWGIPATACRAGSKLAEQPGTVCSGCYALKGAYAWSTVAQAYQRRLDCADHPRWVEAMVVLVRWQVGYNSAPYFRWFDSGDIQDLEMLHRIAEVARQTPEVSHWLPTREYGIVRSYRETAEFPPNLVVRLSALWVDAAPPSKIGQPTSTVHQDRRPVGINCPAYRSSPATCGDCRACWDPAVSNVSYPWH